MDDSKTGLLAYQGDPDCTDAHCRGEVIDGRWECQGWHCAHCHEPCSMMGHPGCSEGVVIKAVKLEGGVVHVWHGETPACELGWSHLGPCEPIDRSPYSLSE